MLSPEILHQVRSRFAHVETCPFQGERVFFENAGGALTLNSVVATSATMAAIPDNQGRDNPAAHELVRIIDQAKADTRLFLGVTGGQVFVGESGTELLFRLVRTAVTGVLPGGDVLGSTLEHPASRSACDQWSRHAGRRHVLVEHNVHTGSVSVEDYLPHISEQTRVATIVHTSPGTGMGVDVGAIAAAIRKISPDCIILVDGIQHAAHGGLDLDSYQIDGYVISPYKVFSRHGYGLAWVSDRLSALPHERLNGTPNSQWELGTRDTGAYATFSDVVQYFEWLGSLFTDSTDRRKRIEAAGVAIKAQEAYLSQCMLQGVADLPGLADMPEVRVIGGVDNPLREGLVAMTIDGIESADVVSELRERGIRTHVRKNDHYSSNFLAPLGLESCVRVSMCHYNSDTEVVAFLTAIQAIIAARAVSAERA